jgi:hypothetical protein
MFNKFLRYGSYSLRVVSETFAPPKGSTSRQVRINGIMCIGVAFGLLALTGLIVLLISRITHAAFEPAILVLPAMFSEASLIVGGYRLVFGMSAKADDSLLMSLARVAFGVTWIVLIFGSVIMAGALLP